MLVLVNHYFGPAEFVGRSTTGQADRRTAVVTEALAALRGLGEALGTTVDVEVCGVPGRSLVPIDRSFAHLEDPRHLPYATIESMVAETDGYDWFVNIEDDILLGADVVRRSMAFARRNRVNEVLLPHRRETQPDGSSRYVDLEAIPGWRRPERRFGSLELGLALNEHAGMTILSAEQVRYAARRVDLGRRDQFHGGLMASAYANLHAPFLPWRTREPSAHAVTHLDAWLDSPVQPDLGPVAARGSVDEITFDGAAVTVRGWGLTPSGSPAPVRGIRFGDARAEPFRLVRTARPDVVAVHPGADEESGFELTFCLLDIADEDLLDDTFGVVVTEDGEERVLPRGAAWAPTDAHAALARVPAVPDEPHMPVAGVRRLTELLARSRSYLEYGTGGSTVLAARCGVRRLVAVENDLSWLLALRHRVERVGGDTEQVWRHEDLGPSGDWGAPLDESGWRRYQSYALGVWRDGWPDGDSPDLVLVDGRFRVACTVASLIHAAPGTPVLFDDYPDRPQYHHIERLLAPVAVHGRLAEFVVPDDLDRDAAWDLLVSAVTDPA